MSNFSAFLAQNAIQIEPVKYVVSKRFVGEDGKPMQWEIGSITTTQDEDLRKSCTKRVQGKRGQFTQETDYNMYLGKLGAMCTRFPDLENAELQNSYKIMGADNLLKTMLTPGEYSEYINKIQEVNGFDTPMEDLVDEAKN